MSFQGMAAITGAKGPLHDELALHLRSKGLLVAEPQRLGAAIRYLFHIWSPQPSALWEPTFAWYEQMVSSPVLTAARLAPGLAHLCLVRTEETSVPVRILEDALGFVSRQYKVPFAVLRAPSDGSVGRLPAVAAFVAGAGVAGRVCVGGRP